MTTIGNSIRVKGEIRSREDLTVEGHIDGPIHCEDVAVVVANGGEVAGEIVARDITVIGRVSGRMIATEIIDVRAGASVSGQIVTSRFVLEAGGIVEGRVEPQHLDTALRVARYQRQQRDNGAAYVSPRH